MAIIGILAVVVLASLNVSRDKADNAAILSQMNEYEKALNLVYSDLGVYPIAFGSQSDAFRHRKVCIGDGAVGRCLGSISEANPAPAGNLLYTEMAKYMSQLPRQEFTSGGVAYSSPALSGCVIHDPAQPTSPTNQSNPDQVGKQAVCQPRHYSVWFILKGANEYCGEAVVADATFGAGNDLTLCRALLD